ncbi:cysteine dioxygenase family protein [Burkholderia sp. TSV86]|uniref:cysteine dioxygenase family protein n=1 Tax=Burkholderia sp. TSV86 TaxID=1385594 RepID=UPI00075CDF7D|nr:cysteine dioxygenase family protein [Burkholderia sp. TSV86]KVE36660.1 cysteine dioxygenase [Burkholderia sp. TSV86]
MSHADLLSPTPNRPAPARDSAAPARSSEPLREPATAAAPSPLERLCARIDAAFDSLTHEAAPSHHPAFAQAVRAALAEAAAEHGLLTPAQRESSADHYRRHLLAADPFGRYAVVSLVWRPGQWSPIHGHRTWCGYAVLEGELTENVYHWDGVTGRVKNARICARAPGSTSYVRAGLAGIHRLGHGGSTTDTPAISLHVYGVRGEDVATHVNHIVAAADALD